MRNHSPNSYIMKHTIYNPRWMPSTRRTTHSLNHSPAIPDSLSPAQDCASIRRLVSRPCQGQPSFANPPDKKCLKISLMRDHEERLSLTPIRFAFEDVGCSSVWVTGPWDLVGRAVYGSHFDLDGCGWRMTRADCVTVRWCSGDSYQFI